MPPRPHTDQLLEAHQNRIGCLTVLGEAARSWDQGK